MNTQQQIYALRTSLNNLKRKSDFKQKDFVIITDQINGKTFAIAENKETLASSGETYFYPQAITGFMNYDKLNHFLLALHFKERFFN